VSGYPVLDPTRPRTGPRDRRWMIQNNLTAERVNAAISNPYTPVYDKLAGRPAKGKLRKLLSVK
jgi:hypothetical protein